MCNQMKTGKRVIASSYRLTRLVKLLGESAEHQVRPSLHIGERLVTKSAECPLTGRSVSCKLFYNS